MNASTGKSILVAAAVVALAAIMVGVFAVGSPGETRLVELDSRRVDDLQGIMGAADSFWARNERLPNSLTELAAEPRTNINILDPVSGDAYLYRTTGPDSFELCTAFDRPSPPTARRSTTGFWRHEAGPICFVFTQGEARR